VKVLLDHCVPKRLKSFFQIHEVETAREVGWDGLKNGKLLAQAATRFEVMLTVDQNIKHQQNLGKLPVAVIVMIARDNRLPTLIPYVPEVEKALLTIKAGELVEVFLPAGPVASDDTG
jgi:hypothetical protein